MIDVYYASLTSQELQRRVFYRNGHPSRYQPCPTGTNFGEQTGTGVFPFVIAALLNVREALTNRLGEMVEGSSSGQASCS